MEPCDNDYPLPAEVSETLVKLTEFAKSHEILIVNLEVRWDPSGDGRLITLSGAGDKTEDINQVQGDPITSLKMLNLVLDVEGGLDRVFVTRAAFSKAKYEKKRKLGQLVERAYQSGRAAISIIALCVSILAAIASLIALL